MSAARNPNIRLRARSDADADAAHARTTSASTVRESPNVFYQALPQTEPVEPLRKRLRERERADDGDADDAIPTLLGPAWMHARVLAHIASLRNDVVRFARIVAGLMNGSLEDFTREPAAGLGNFLALRGHDLEALVAHHAAPAKTPRTALLGAAASSGENAASGGENAAVSGENAADTQTPPPPPSADTQTPLTTPASSAAEASNATVALALAYAGALNAHMAPYLDQVADALDGGARRARARGLMEWLQLPEHVGHIFFSDDLSAGFLSAYTDVADMARRDYTFADLVARVDLRVYFARLVAAHMRIARCDAPRRYMLKGARDDAVRDRNALVRWFAAHDATPFTGGGGGGGNFSFANVFA
jgi:hypothetical protein